MSTTPHGDPSEPRPRQTRNSSCADNGPIPEVRYVDFLDAQRDPTVKEFLRDAQDESDRLKREGLIHL